jgi:hypothetical protein
MASAADSTWTTPWTGHRARRPLRHLPNSVSKHVCRLERAGLVRGRRAGREHLLSPNPEPLDEAATWIERQRGLWSARLDALDELLRAEGPPAEPGSDEKGRSA